MTEEEIILAKKNLRCRIQNLRKSMPKDERDRKSKIIIDKLKETNFFVKAQIVMLYASTAYEVQIYPLIEHGIATGKTVLLPLITGKGKMEAAKINSLAELAPDKYGILSPDKDNAKIVAPADIDLIIVPGAAFTADGHRLGLGGGYYDRFLPEAEKAYRVALAFDFQLADNLPMASHDEKVDAVITENKIFFCNERQ